MNGLVFLLGAVLLVGVSEQVVINKYNQEVFSRAQEAGFEAQKCIQAVKIETKADKHYIFGQANDFYFHIGRAIHIANIAVDDGRLDAALQKRLNDATREVSEASVALLRALNEGQAGPIKEKLSAILGNAAKNIGQLSKIASDVDKIEGLKSVEGRITHANDELLRAFFQVSAQCNFYGKTNSEIQARVTEIGLKANSQINKVAGTGEFVAKVLKAPARHLVELIDIVLIQLDNLVYDEETVKNAGDVRKVYKEFAKIYPDAVNLKIRFRYQQDDENLKKDFTKYTDRVSALISQLPNLIQGDTGKALIGYLFPQAEIFSRFLSHYLGLYKIK